MKLEIRLVKKQYEPWCLEHNYNAKNKKTPLLFLKDKLKDGSYVVSEGEESENELVNDTLERIDLILKNIDNVELVIEGTKHTYILEDTDDMTKNESTKEETKEKDNEITEKDFEVFKTLVDCICELYGAPKIDLSKIKKDEKLFKTLMANTLGVKETFDVLVDICMKAELALAVDRLFENEENKGE